MSQYQPPDRSYDISQPLADLSPDERMKAASNQLRGHISEGLREQITGAVPGSGPKLMKFHGIYQQDDRDLRGERARKKLEPAFSFMVRIRLPGGVCTASQWLKLDQLARAYAGQTLRLTTRQTFQLHRVLKTNLQPTIQGLRSVLLDTRAACGDDSRGVMCSVTPQLSTLHAEISALAKRASDHAIPKTGAYREIWYEEEHEPKDGPEEPFYGATYMPRKFKIGFVIPPVNDIDVYAQDLGFIAITQRGKLVGFNVAIGGGLGRTDKAPHTYPRLADVIGFVALEEVLATIDAVMAVQRDYGNRADRSRARFKYTIDDKGLDWIKAEIEARLGFALLPARPYRFTSNGDLLGWSRGDNGRLYYTVFFENGRIANVPGASMAMDGLREIARIHEGTFRLTPNQNLMIADIPPSARNAMTKLMRRYGLDTPSRGSVLRLNAMACVALPTCGLAMAESERYLPQLITKLDTIMEAHGLAGDPITVRMTGCPNGCARPYIAEIGLTGRAAGRYNLFLGGGFHGQRLNKMYLENANEEEILSALDKVLAHYARERHAGERFGDFVIRAGYVAEVKEGRHFND